MEHSTQVLDDCRSTILNHERPDVGRLKVGSLLIEGVSHDIFRGVNIIGRDDVCDVVIKSGAISSKHAVIEVEDWDTHLVYDCGSTNKTRLGKTILKPNVRYNLQGSDDLIFADLKAIYTKRKLTVQELEDLNKCLIGVENPFGDGNEDDNLFLLPTQTIKELKSKQKDESNKRANLSLSEDILNPIIATKLCKDTESSETRLEIKNYKDILETKISRQCLDNQNKEPSDEDFENALTQVNTNLLENKKYNIIPCCHIYQKSKTVKHKENVTNDKSVDPRILITNKENQKARIQYVKTAKYSSYSDVNKTPSLKSTTASPETLNLKCKEGSNIVIKEEIDTEMQQINDLNHGAAANSQENNNISYCNNRFDKNIAVLPHQIKSECEIKEESVDEVYFEENYHTYLATKNINMSCERDFVRDLVPFYISNEKEHSGKVEELNGNNIKNKYDIPGIENRIDKCNTITEQESNGKEIKQSNQAKEVETHCNEQYSVNVKIMSKCLKGKEKNTSVSANISAGKFNNESIKTDLVEKNSYKEIAKKPDYHSKFNLRTAYVAIGKRCDDFQGFSENKSISSKIKNPHKVIDPKYSNTKEKELKRITLFATNKNVPMQSKQKNANKTKDSISEKSSHGKMQKVTYKNSDKKGVLNKDGVKPISKISGRNIIANIIDENKMKTHREDSQFHKECYKLSEPSSSRPNKRNLTDLDVFTNVLKENVSSSKVTDSRNKRKTESDTRDEISKVKSSKLYSHSKEEIDGKINSGYGKSDTREEKDLTDISFGSSCKRKTVKPARFRDNVYVQSECSSSEKDFVSGIRKRKSIGSESCVVETRKTINTDDSRFKILLETSFPKKSKEIVSAKDLGNPDKARSKSRSVKTNDKINCRRISKSKSVSSETSTNNRQVSKSPRRSLNKGEKVLFTGFSNTTYEANVKKLGGAVVDSPDSCTVLVTDKVRRTVKFLCALAQGKPIVDPEWIEQSWRCKCFEDPMNHLLLDVEAQLKFSFDLRQTINEAKKKPMLNGYTIHTTPSVKPPPDDIKSIVESCGGKFLPKVPSKWPDQTIVISHPDDKSLWKNLKVQGSTPPIVAAEFLLLGVLQHRIDILTHKIY